MRKSVGMMGVILGGLCLSLEICLLRVIQGLDKAAGAWYTDALAYAGESPCLIALAITAAMIALSAYIFVKGKEG